MIFRMHKNWAPVSLSYNKRFCVLKILLKNLPPISVSMVIVGSSCKMRVICFNIIRHVLCDFNLANYFIGNFLFRGRGNIYVKILALTVKWWRARHILFDWFYSFIETVFSHFIYKTCLAIGIGPCNCKGLQKGHLVSPSLYSSSLVAKSVYSNRIWFSFFGLFITYKLKVWIKLE